MAELTLNYKFKLPLNTERASQIPFNENFKILDEKLYECALKTSLSETDNKLSSLDSQVKSNHSAFTTFQENVEKNYYTSSTIDGLLTSYAKTSDLSVYAKKSELSVYAKTSDLSAYVTTDTFTQNINNLNTVYVSKTNLNTEIDSLNTYAKKSDLNNYATTAILNQNINNLSTVYVSKTNLNAEIANLNTYVTKSELSSYVTTSALSSLEARVKALEDAQTA